MVKTEAGLNIFFIDGTRFNNQMGANYLVNKYPEPDYENNPDATPLPVINFGFEEGTLLDNSVLNSDFYSVKDFKCNLNFYKAISYKDGNLTLGEAFTAPEAFGLSENAEFSYMISENVYNVGFSAGGQLLDTKAYAEDVTPTAPQLPDDVLTKDGEVYYEEHATGWTDVEGGEAVKIAPASADVTYYVAVVKKPATFVELNSESQVLTYSTSDVITLAQFQAFKAGSTIELFDDLTYEEAEDIVSYKNNLTFDLNGNTLYLQSNPIKLIGNSLTVEDGYVVSIASDNIFHGDPNKTALANNKLTLTDVDFTTQLNFIHCPAGEFYIDNCTVTLADGKSKGTVFHHDIRYGAQDVTTTILVEANNLDVYGFGTNFVNLYLRSTRVSTYDMSFSFTDCNLQNQGRMFNMALDKGYSAEQGVNDILNVSFVRCNMLARTHDEGAEPGDQVFFYAPAASGITDATCYFEDCQLSARPTFGCGEIIYADGQVMANSDDAIYPIRVLDPNYSLKANLTLFSDFTINFYIPENTTVKSITIGDKTYDLEKLTADVLHNNAIYYGFSQSGIRADKAIDKISYTVVYYDENLGETITVTEGYSVLDYANALLASNFTADSKRLLCAAMEYVLAAYEYTLEEGQTVPAELTKFFTNANYIAPTEVTVPTSTTNEGNIADAIVDARLNLSSELKLRFKLVADYSGTLIINNQSYAVVDGKYQDADYIELNLRAYDLGDQIIAITSADGAINGTYDLAAYINSVAGTNTKLDNLLETLYTYCYEANLYKDAHPELD